MESGPHHACYLTPHTAFWTMPIALLIEPYVAILEYAAATTLAHSIPLLPNECHCRPNADTNRMQAEWNVLSDSLASSSVEYDLRREDDVIFLGDFVSAEFYAVTAAAKPIAHTDDPVPSVKLATQCLLKRSVSMPLRRVSSRDVVVRSAWISNSDCQSRCNRWCVCPFG